jgi:hypothetical protein
MSKDYRPRLNKSQFKRYTDLEKDNNILVVGDLHAPFIREGYLEHCVDIKDKYSCNEIVFIGDIIDNHYSSFHVTDPDGYAAGEELQRAVDMIAPWRDEFPVAKVMLGNHDRIPARKAMDAGLSKHWLRPYEDVFNTPSWDFVDSYVKDEVLYVHGDGASHASIRAKKDLMSIVQGHFHTKAYAEFFVGRNFKIFAVQTPVGVDDSAYAMAYGKNSPRSAIGCTVVINNGELPILEMMQL